MSVIGMLGFHAIGKSTALKRWKAKYGDRLETYSLDDMRRAYPNDSDKLQLVRDCRNNPNVCVIETARGYSTWLGSFTSDEPVIVLTCEGESAKQYMLERRNGKPITDYWTDGKLRYEGSDRYVNFVEKNLHPSQYSLFSIDDRERDWPAVDEYFGKLFRRLWNRGLR